MDCIYCNKCAVLEPINKGYAKVATIYRCRDCRAQFTYDKKGALINSVFFREINNHPFSIQTVYPNFYVTDGVTIVRRHDGTINGSGIENEVLKLPLIDGLTPENAQKKLQLWITFS